MEKTRVAIIGYGNIGKYAVEAVLSAPDMELAGVVRRNAKASQPVELSQIKVAEDVDALGHVDVALLALPTRNAPDTAKTLLKKGIRTVDSFDIHGSIWDVRCELEEVAKQHGTAAIVSAGWDPGSDSMVRALLEACAPKGITYTNFGPGMSMGHSVAVKAIAGVENALSMTIPLGSGIHRRMIYVQSKAGADMKQIEAAIHADPYFSHDETHVIETPDLEKLLDRGSGVHMVRKGVAGTTQNQLFEFNMKIDNPAVTSQIMTACARAVMKQQSGAYTLIEIPVIDLLYGNKEDLIRKLV